MMSVLMIGTFLVVRVVLPLALCLGLGAMLEHRGLVP